MTSNENPDAVAAEEQKQENAAHHAQQVAGDAQYKAAQDAAADKFLQDQAQTNKVLAERAQEEAAAPERQAQAKAANNEIIGGTLGIIGAVAGLELMGRLEGVTPVATIAGKQNAGVIAGLMQENGISMASAPALDKGPEAPKTAMNFLTPTQNGMG